MIFTYISLGLTGLFIVISLLFLAYMAASKPYVFLSMILTYFALTSSTFLWLNSSISTQYLGFNLYPEDFFTAAAIFANVFIKSDKVIFSKAKSLELLRFCAKLVISGIVLGIIFWTFLFNLKIGVNSWRNLLLVFTLFLYSLKFCSSFTLKNLKVLLILPGLLLGIVTAIRFTVQGIGRSEYIAIDPLTGEVLGRATSALGAYFILIAGIGAFYLIKENRFYRFTILIMAVLEVILLQHRTVWVSAIISLIFFLLLRDRNDTKYLSVFKFFVIPLVIFVAWFFDKKYSAIASAATNTETFGWRTSRWSESMSASRSILEWFFGSIFGPIGPTDPTIIRAYSHSSYINQIEYLGFVGLIILIMIIVTSFNFSKQSIQLGNLVRIFVASAVGFGFTYQIPIPFFLLVPIFLQLSRLGSSGSEELFSRKIRRLNGTT